MTAKRDISSHSLKSSADLQKIQFRLDYIDGRIDSLQRAIAYVIKIITKSADDKEKRYQEMKIRKRERAY